MSSGTEADRVWSTVAPGLEWDSLGSLAASGVVHAFEAAWQQGQRPDLEDYRPAGKEWPRSLLSALICVALRYRLALGEAVRIEEYIGRYSFLTTEQWLDLLLVEWQQRLCRPPAPHPQELLGRFPNWRHAFRDHPLFAEEPPKGYEIRAVLGKGGMGVVTLAHDHKLHRPVALKTLRERCATSAEYCERFRREAAAAGKLNHPNIVQVYCAWEQGGWPFYAMEYVCGPSLAEELRRHPLDEARSLWLMEKIARGMAEAHEKGIIHRDLKPSNILLAPRPSSDLSEEGSGPWVPKVADFGLAFFLEPEGSPLGLTALNQCLGTPNYMAPEQARGRSREAGAAVDVYGMGAILYELLTGRPPFVGDNHQDVLDQVKSERPCPPSQFAPQINRHSEALCLRCLEKNPRQRFPSALEFAEELRSLRTTGFTANGTSQLDVASRSALPETPLPRVVDVTPALADDASGSWLSRLWRKGQEPRFIWAVGGATVFFTGTLLLWCLMNILIILLKNHSARAELNERKPEAALFVAGCAVLFFVPLLVAGWKTIQGKRGAMWTALILLGTGCLYCVAVYLGATFSTIHLLLGQKEDSGRLTLYSLFAALNAVGVVCYANALRISYLLRSSLS